MVVVTKSLLIIAAHTSALVLHFEHHIAGLATPLIKFLSLPCCLALSKLRIAIQGFQLSLIDRTALAEQSLDPQDAQ